MSTGADPVCPARRPRVSAVEFYDDCWPLLLTVFPDRAMSDQEWREYLERLADHRNRHPRMILVTETTGVRHMPSAKQRSIIAEYDEKMDAGEAPTFVVMHSKALRGVVTALSWLSRQSFEVEYFSDLKAALDAAESFATNKGMELRQPTDVLLRRRSKAG
jgi:hypothetical protein